MKYTWRIISISILVFSGALFKINDYVTLGYIPVMEWVISIIFIFPVWWIGLQIDKARFYAGQLQEKDKELNELFDSVDAAIYSFDLRSKQLMVSTQVQELYGRSSEEFKENTWLWKELIYPGDIHVIDTLNQTLKDGKEAIFEYRIQLPNGDLKWIQRRAKPILDSNGNLIKVNGIDLDINHRKKVEELLYHTQEQNRKLLEKRLDETEQRFKSLFVNNTDAIFTFNLEGYLLGANKAAEELIGYTFGEFKDKDWKSFFLPEDHGRYREYFTAAIEGKRQEFTMVKLHRDGSKRVVWVKMIPIITNNRLLGIYEICKDITEAKMAEEMIRRSDKLSVVGQLAAGVAHEIRNPLTTLKGFIQLFKSDIDQRYVDIMVSELDRINLIVSEFLILSKPQVISYEYQDIKQIINEIIPLLEPQAHTHNIQFYIDYDVDLPSIYCEQNQLKQVFINLLKNAIEAMPDGGEIGIQAKLTNQDTLNIFIIDQGIGIDEEQIPKLGEPFFSTKEEGTGLGLMVSFRIIESHGGRMKITSEINQGTTIEICLPLQQS
jgi:PAS domain S-box-containing protein